MPPRGVAASPSIEKKRKRVAQLDSGENKKQTRLPHCQETGCHVAKSDPDYQTIARGSGRRVHECPRKPCLKYATCRAKTDKMRRQFHERECLLAEIAAEEEAAKV